MKPKVNDTVSFKKQNEVRNGGENLRFFMLAVRNRSRSDGLGQLLRATLPMGRIVGLHRPNRSYRRSWIMTTSTSHSKNSSSSSDQRSSESSRVRIDMPHHTENVESRHPADVDEDGDFSFASIENLPDWQRRQINQLARLLRDRHFELDRREAELNARLADLEAEERNATIRDSVGPHEGIADSTSYSADPKKDRDPASSVIRGVEETLLSWRKKWRGQTDESSDAVAKGVSTRIDLLVEAESQLAQQWALLKQSQQTQSVREKDFEAYCQRAEQELAAARAEHCKWQKRDQQVLERQTQDIENRELQIERMTADLETSWQEITELRDQLEFAWHEVRTCLPSHLRRRLDQVVTACGKQIDQQTAKRHFAVKVEILKLS